MECAILHYLGRGPLVEAATNGVRLEHGIAQDGQASITASATPAVDRAMDALGHPWRIPLSSNAPFFPLLEP